MASYQRQVNQEKKRPCTSKCVQLSFDQRRFLIVTREDALQQSVPAKQRQELDSKERANKYCLVWGERVFIPHAQPQQELDAVGWESTSPLEPPVEQAGSLDLGLRRRN